MTFTWDQWIRRMASCSASVVLGAALVVGPVAQASGTRSGHVAAPVLPGTTCPAFPADNVWNTPVTGLPVDPRSTTWLASMASATTFLHPDFGPSGRPSKPFGIPWQVVPSGTPLAPIRFTYPAESDPGPYPLTAVTPVEGGSDRHAVMVDAATCSLYETWRTHFRASARSTAGSGAIWNLTSDVLRPAGWTSADAAGLSVLAGLVNFDQVMSGAMDHAIRFTVACTQQAYEWPARHQAGQVNPSCPPMGARFRLNSTFSLPMSSCATACQTVLTTLRTYGMFLADNGSNWFFQGTADTRWTTTQVSQLKQVPASAFEAVDESCLQVAPDSGQALQPGTTAYNAACG
jgi:hypothetical protein